MLDAAGTFEEAAAVGTAEIPSENTTEGIEVCKFVLIIAVEVVALAIPVFKPVFADPDAKLETEDAAAVAEIPDPVFDEPNVSIMLALGRDWAFTDWAAKVERDCKLDTAAAKEVVTVPRYDCVGVENISYG